VLISLGPNPARFAIAIAAFAAIVFLRAAPWLVVVAAAALGALLRA
jgi:hypothetical protein